MSNEIVEDDPSNNMDRRTFLVMMSTAAIAAISAVAAGCGGGGGAPPTGGPPPFAQIGSSGGTVTLANEAQIVIPAGALTSTITVSLTAVKQSNSTTPLPTGLALASPLIGLVMATTLSTAAQLTIDYSASLLQSGTPASNIALYQILGGAYVLVATSVTTTSSGTVSAYVINGGVYAVLGTAPS